MFSCNQAAFFSWDSIESEIQVVERFRVSLKSPAKQRHLKKCHRDRMQDHLCEDDDDDDDENDDDDDDDDCK